MDKNEKMRAQKEFESVCAVLDGHGWAYDKDKNEFEVGFTADGKDMPIGLTLKVNPELMTVTAYALIPVEPPEDKAEDLAVATALVNEQTVHGNFEYDVKTRRIYFRVSTSYRDSEVDKDVYFYLIGVAFSTADKVAVVVKALCDGTTTLDKLIEAVNG